MIKEEIKQKVRELPSSSGVYLMHDDKGEIIYVGKAKNLKNRVSSYFNNSQKAQKVWDMVEKVSFFEYFLTPTELDAFLLERNLIRKHQPYFNILLKDGKAFPYIKISLKDKYPKFKIVRKVIKDGAKYFGPYLGVIDPKEILETINYAYKIRTCNNAIDGIKFKKRPCLNYSMGKCLAPCSFAIEKSAYDLEVKKAIEYLSGNDKDVIKILTEKMLDASQAENYEVALNLKNKIILAKKLENKSVAELPISKEFDVFAIANNGINCVISSMFVRGGKVLAIENYNLVSAGIDSADELASFMFQFYEKHPLTCSEILINYDLEDKTLLDDFLSKSLDKKVSVIVPEKGYKKKLLLMAENNANEYLSKSLSREKKKYNETFGGMKQLQETLELKNFPKRIECYDISHISGEYKVGSMVVFKNGEKNTKLYRKFKIKTIEGSDDFACLKEVLLRRLSELNKGDDISFAEKPDLIVIDGGKGQLSKIFEVFQTNNITGIDLISLAKKFEEVYKPQEHVAHILPKTSYALRILQNIRDESHRFAITYHRTLRTNEEILKNSKKKK